MKAIGLTLYQFDPVICQTVGDPFARITKTQLLHPSSTAALAPETAIVDLQPDLSSSQVYIPNHPPMSLRMNRSRWLCAIIAERMVAQIRCQLDQGTARFRVNSLVCNFHSHEREIRCYAAGGHCVVPFASEVPCKKEL